MMKSKYMVKPKVLTVAFFMFSTLTRAQSPPAIQWQQSFGSTGYDELTAVRGTSDGGSIIGGYSEGGISGNKTSPGFGSSDFWVFKLDSNGGKQWEKSFGGASSE